jgi:hypothetical protein
MARLVRSALLSQPEIRGGDQQHFTFCRRLGHVPGYVASFLGTRKPLMGIVVV